MTKKFRYLSEGEPAPKAAKAEGKKATAAKATVPVEEGAPKRRKRATSFSAPAPEPAPAVKAPAPTEEPAAPKRGRRASSLTPAAAAPDPAPSAPPADEPARPVRRPRRSGFSTKAEPPAAAEAAPEPEPAATPATEAPAAEAPAAEAAFTIETVPATEVAEEEADYSSSTFRRRPRAGRKKATTAAAAPEPAATTPAPAAEAPAPEPAAVPPAAPAAPAAEPAPKPAAAAPAPPAPAAAPPAPKQPSRREVNEGLVRSLLSARADDDQAALRRLLSDDIALILPGADSFIGRDAVFGAWARQAELLDESLAFEADMRSIAASDDHVFTYVETWAEAPGSGGVSYTTLTAYRIRGGQVVEIRQHVDDVDGYGDFWLALGRSASS